VTHYAIGKIRAIIDILKRALNHGVKKMDISTVTSDSRAVPVTWKLGDNTAHPAIYKRMQYIEVTLCVVSLTMIENGYS
jgi:hypothetical protein